MNEGFPSLKLLEVTKSRSSCVVFKDEFFYEILRVMCTALFVTCGFLQRNSTNSVKDFVDTEYSF